MPWVIEALVKSWREYKNIHTSPGIRRTVGEYVSQCLTNQQARDKHADVRFHLKKIQSGYFNELVQQDHLKLCPTDDGNTGAKLCHAVTTSITQSLPLDCCFRNGLPSRYTHAHAIGQCSELDCRTRCRTQR